MVYDREVVPESFLWRGYIQSGDTYALRFLFTPTSTLATVALNESMQQELHTTHYTTALGDYSVVI